MEYKQIQELIKLVNKSNIGELKIREGDFEIMIRSQGYVEAVKSKLPGGAVAMAPMAGTAMLNQPVGDQGHVESQSHEKTETPSDDTSGLITVKSPMIGTFYRSPSPDKDPYIKVGDSINKGDVICIIEAMKLFNEIESEVEGKIVKVLIEDSSPVEYDQPLFLVDPNA
jgi:acetyl-CoA carboxylase biotin carboxyl carrier protein